LTEGEVALGGKWGEKQMKGVTKRQRKRTFTGNQSMYRMMKKKDRT